MSDRARARVELTSGTPGRLDASLKPPGAARCSPGSPFARPSPHHMRDGVQKGRGARARAAGRSAPLDPTPDRRWTPEPQLWTLASGHTTGMAAGRFQVDLVESVLDQGGGREYANALAAAGASPSAMRSTIASTMWSSWRLSSVGRHGPAQEACRRAPERGRCCRGTPATSPPRHRPGAAGSPARAGTGLGAGNPRSRRSGRGPARETKSARRGGGPDPGARRSRRRGRARGRDRRRAQAADHPDGVAGVGGGTGGGNQQGAKMAGVGGGRQGG